ncbi:MAG: SGNH/GDSL hydrolase family protein [Candidatus Aquirickettsiella sp.]
MPNTFAVQKPPISGAIIFGDSLSDEGKKYNEDVCCCIPFKWFLYHSDYNNFTNGHTWTFILVNILNEILKEKSTWLESEKASYFKNVAEGGATAYNYRNITSFFRCIKGFILSFFLGNIQKQAKNLKRDKNILNPTKLGIIFAGANDLVTLGYDDVQGIERAVQGLSKTIEILIKNDNADSNFLRSLVLIGLPDISETPRFANKSADQKNAMKLACQQFNQKLQELANKYQYVNFGICNVYNYKNIDHLDLEKVKKDTKDTGVTKAIIVIGKGKDRTVFFINNGEFMTNNSSKEFKKVNIKLSKEQLAIFSEDGQITRDEINGNKLNAFVNEVTKKAKLNLDLRMLDIGIIFNKICQNPEAYGFTSGCAVYYLPEIESQKSDELLISNHITKGNAIIIKETNSGFASYLVKDGQLLKEQNQIVKVKLELSVINEVRLKKEIKEKIEQHPSEKEIIQLVDMEGKHDSCIINAIQSVVEHYKKKFHTEIVLTEIHDSVLQDIKKKYLNQDAIFWDDLHPARRVHDILASEIAEFIESNYVLNNPSNFRDDSAIGIKPKLSVSPYAEAPGFLPAEPSLLIK